MEDECSGEDVVNNLQTYVIAELRKQTNKTKLKHVPERWWYGRAGKSQNLLSQGSVRAGTSGGKRERRRWNKNVLF